MCTFWGCSRHESVGVMLDVVSTISTIFFVVVVARYTLSEVLDILETEDFFDADVFMQPPNKWQLPDKDSHTEEGTDVQHLLTDQLSAPADFWIDFGSYVAAVFWPKKKCFIILMKKNMGQKMNRLILWILQMKNNWHRKFLHRKTVTGKKKKFQRLILMIFRCPCLLF